MAIVILATGRNTRRLVSEDAQREHNTISQSYTGGKNTGLGSALDRDW